MAAQAAVGKGTRQGAGSVDARVRHGHDGRTQTGG